MIGPLSYIDVALLALAAISGLLAMYRGLGRELLSIVSWIVGAAVALYFFLHQQKLALDLTSSLNLSSPKIAPIAISAVVGLITLIVVHLLTTRVSESILDSRIGIIDRSLGLVYGVLRAFLIILIPYMFYQNFTPEKTEPPEWVSRSVSRGMFDGASRALKPTLLAIFDKFNSKTGSGAAEQ